MIILDEQLMGRDLEIKIARWYRGKVQFISDLRPGSVIKDDAIPGLLRQQNQPAFVTINERDFWRKVTIDKQYCIICFVLSDSRAGEIPDTLRVLFRHPEFSVKAKRMGKVIRVGTDKVSYYSYEDRKIRVLKNE